MINLLTIIGARPQIIKAAALSRAIKTFFSKEIEEKILHTGQHYDKGMSDIFFEEMNIPSPSFNLNIGSGKHGEQTAKMISGIETVLESHKFDAVVVFGDTNSTLAGAIAASKLHIPIVHIEAGLRSFNMQMPEEINRIACDHLSTLLFAPTETAITNLKNEGFETNSVSFGHKYKRSFFNSGDIMYDNSLYFSNLADGRTDIIQRLGIENKDFILTTIHRDNNTDNPQRLSSIFEAMLEIVENNQVKIVLPIHPRTQKMLPKNLSKEMYRNVLNNSDIMIIPPASFFEIIVLEKRAKLIMTDSGGVQKEAYFFKKPSIILRPETEWIEIVEQRAGIVADANKNNIVAAFKTFFNKKNEFPDVFGNGKASEFILNKIVENLK